MTMDPENPGDLTESTKFKAATFKRQHSILARFAKNISAVAVAAIHQRHTGLLNSDLIVWVYLIPSRPSSSSLDVALES